MALFGFSQRDTVTTFSTSGPAYAGPLGAPGAEFERGGVSFGNSSPVHMAADRGQAVAPASLPDQFFVFHLNPSEEGPTIIEAAQAEPEKEGSAEEEPDMLVSLQMESFHLARSEDLEPDTRATMRITCGKDQSSTDRLFDTLFWSAAAGMKLYEQFKSPEASPKDTKADLRRAFGNRPIEVPGSLAVLSFEVVKHREPAWWRRIFSFLQSDTAESLVSLLGFPAISLQAIKVLDELLNRLDDSEPAPLFQSAPMRLALSKWARDSYTAGSRRVKIGCLNPGFCVLARGRDYAAIAGSNAIYLPSYNRLVPADVSDDKLLNGRYDDPLADVTYAVFRVGMKPTKLDPTFDFGR